MTPDLFPVPEVLSPRLLWMKKHSVRVHHAPNIGEGGYPWCVWLWDNDGPEGKEGIPERPDLCGYGKTEDDALVHLALIHHLRLWNEEP